MPRALIGMESRTWNGDPICFNHNLPGGCDKAKWGERCPKGLHVCKQNASCNNRRWGTAEAVPRSRRNARTNFDASGAPFPQPSLPDSDETKCGKLSAGR